MALLREKSLLKGVGEVRSVKRHRNRRVWKLTVNPKQPLLSLSSQEFALGHDPRVVLASPDDNPGHCPLTQK